LREPLSVVQRLRHRRKENTKATKQKREHEGSDGFSVFGAQQIKVFWFFFSKNNISFFLLFG